MRKENNTGINEETKQKMIGIIHALIPGCKIYLFGSRATGTHVPASDVDIALDAGKPIEPRIKVGEVREVLNGLYTAYKIDVVDLNKVNETMKHFILQDGILWNK